MFLRPGELPRAEWAHIDFEAAEWRIPPRIMKLPDQHIVPLSRQALDILRSLQALTGHGRFVFPCLGNPDRPMSENTLNKALRILGYGGDEMTAHGFRSIASTLLNEQHRWTGDAIERQLAHWERDSTRAAYNYAEYLPERREMMQSWADYLDDLRTGRKAAPAQKNRSPATVHLNTSEQEAGRIASDEILLMNVVASREMSPLVPSTGGHDGQAAHPCGTN